MINFSFSHSVFKRLVSQGHQKVSLCGNRLNEMKDTPSKQEEHRDGIFSAILVIWESLLFHVAGFRGTLWLFLSLDALCRYVV